MAVVKEAETEEDSAAETEADSAAETEEGSVVEKEGGSEAAATAAVEECVQKKMYSSGQ